jgi:hypothetical protein
MDGFATHMSRKTIRMAKSGQILPLQIRRDFGELGEGGLEVFGDVGIGKVGAVFEAFVFQPKEVRSSLPGGEPLIESR